MVDRRVDHPVLPLGVASGDREQGGVVHGVSPSRQAVGCAHSTARRSFSDWQPQVSVSQSRPRGDRHDRNAGNAGTRCACKSNNEEGRAHASFSTAVWHRRSGPARRPARRAPARRSTTSRRRASSSAASTSRACPASPRSTPQTTGPGLDIDVCRAVAAALFGDATKVKYTPLNAKERFTALQSGEIDVLSRNTTWTSSRDSALGLELPRRQLL